MLIQEINDYLRLRRAAGFKLRDTEMLLKDFAGFAAERGETYIRADTSLAWARTASSVRQRARRLNTLILFARHIRAENGEHQVPPEAAFGHPPRSRPLPHIFSPDQIAQIVAEAKQLPPIESLRPHTYHTLFGLLASCGLRISEALALNIDDIRPDGLYIRETKFRKSRLLPLHPTSARQMALYVNRRQQQARAETRVFVSLRGKALHYSTVNQTFLYILRKLGLRPGPGKPGARINDLRHTFAVRSLENCPDGRTRIAKHMLALSTYLGHTHITDTYWYLHTTPHLMTDIADLCEAYTEGGQS